MDITYDVADADSPTLKVTLAICSAGGTTWTVPCTSATGAVGGAVTPGAAKAVIWDAGADWNGQWSERMRVKSAVDGTSFMGKLREKAGLTTLDLPPPRRSGSTPAGPAPHRLPARPARRSAMSTCEDGTRLWRRPASGGPAGGLGGGRADGQRVLTKRMDSAG